MNFIKIILKIVPGKIGLNIVKFLASRPINYTPKQEEKEFLARGKLIEFERNKFAWSYGQGPLVIFIHGWGGAAAQFSQMAHSVSDLGFTSITFDVSGHGKSNGNKLSFRSFIDDLNSLVNHLGRKNIHSIVGHSAGALCMMAARYIHKIEANNFVCISTPSLPYPPIKIIKRKLDPPNYIIDEYKKYLGKQFDCDYEKITSSAFKKDGASKLLLIYDDGDKYLNKGDLKSILKFWNDPDIEQSTGFGHSKLLKSERLIEKVSSFLNRSTNNIRVSS